MGVESVKAVGEVCAPGDCEVIAVNSELGVKPSLLNTSPEGDGWLVRLRFSNEPSGLMDQAAYNEHVEAQGISCRGSFGTSRSGWWTGPGRNRGELGRSHTAEPFQCCLKFLIW